MSNYIVRYGAMRHLGVMSSRVDGLKRGDRVVSRTNRGMEVADVLCEATEDALSHMDEPPNGQVLRRLTTEDESDLRHIETRRDEIFSACRQQIRDSKLDMQLVDVEQLLGGERIIVYYLAEHRVDFRELVRTLATELQTRIEMRQIGVRDEAKLLADYGDCGKPVCCNTHLSKMPPVSMKMAKLQKATLDPNKISGRCGRLKCCLRYEYDTYEAIHKELPPIGSEILTRDGKCWVLNQEVLAEQLLVETEDHRRRLVHGSEVLSVVRRGSNRGGRGKRRGAPRGPASGSERPPNNDSQGTSEKKSEPSQTPAASQARQSKSPDATSSTHVKADRDDSSAAEATKSGSTDSGERAARKPRRRRGKRREGSGAQTPDDSAPATESSSATTPVEPPRSQDSSSQAPPDGAAPDASGNDKPRRGRADRSRRNRRRENSDSPTDNKNDQNDSKPPGNQAPGTQPPTEKRPPEPPTDSV